MATPKLAAASHVGGPGLGSVKCAASPSASRKTTAHTPTRAPNLMSVRPFWRLAPQRTPT
jgi:hypothetical protein